MPILNLDCQRKYGGSDRSILNCLKDGNCLHHGGKELELSTDNCMPVNHGQLVNIKNFRKN